MPAQLDSTGLLADVDVTGRDHAWPLAKPQLVLQGELRLENIVLAEVRSAVVYMRFLNVKSGCGLGWVVRSEVAGGKGGVVLQEVSEHGGGGLRVVLRLWLVRVRHDGPAC